MSKEPAEFTELDEIRHILGNCFCNHGPCCWFEKNYFLEDREFDIAQEQALIAWHKSECLKMLERLKGQKFNVGLTALEPGVWEQDFAIPESALDAEIEALK